MRSNESFLKIADISNASEGAYILRMTTNKRLL